MRKVKKVRLAPRVRPVRKVLLVIRVLLETKVRLGRRVLLVIKETKDKKVLRVLNGSLPLVHPQQQEPIEMISTLIQTQVRFTNGTVVHGLARVTY